MSFDTIASQSSVDTVVSALTTKGFHVDTFGTKEEALKRIIEIIPKGSSVMNGSSKTLEQIGYQEYLKIGTHGWTDLHKTIRAETDPLKRADLRKKALTADFYLGSVHAITETGDFIVASSTGSQLPHIAFSSPNLILVIGTQKIVPTLEDAMARLEKYVVPLENEHMKQLYGVGTQLNKILIVKGENSALKRTIHILFVKESLGF